MVIINKTCNIHAVAMYTSLQHSICQFTKLHTNPQVIQTLEFLLQQRWVNKSLLIKVLDWKVSSHLPYQLLIQKNHWRLITDFILKIIEKPGHVHMRQTQFHIHSLERKDHIIYLHQSMTGPIKSVLGKLMSTIMQPEVQLVVVSWDAESRQRFAMITQLGLTLR